jgi:D-cysteine desulfhydrase family pyridoxal phosphate-dependent enzyme
MFLETIPFAACAPSWSRVLRPLPEAKICLGMLPTPVHAWRPPVFDGLGLAWCAIKRDDMSGGPDLGGNKVRKLEFLLADAKRQGADTIVTIGGIQSNHARATAVAARLCGFSSSLILRVSDRDVSSEIGMGGNLLFGRLAGAEVRTVTKREYAAHGSAALLLRHAERLAAEGRRPYVIPVGGSNALGTWGYLTAVAELVAQLGETPPPANIVVACGSGGTVAGIALGVRLAGLRGTHVHAVGVCDTPEAFYEHIRQIADELGLALREGELEETLTIHQGKGVGYALSTRDELRTLSEAACATGVTLDSVYSGKALHHFAQFAHANAERFRGSSLLFWHTGGALGMATAESDAAFAHLMPPGQVQRLLDDEFTSAG